MTSLKIKGIKINIENGVFIVSILIFLLGYSKHSILHILGDLSILWSIVIIHELAHLLVARNLGYTCDDITLTFFGGFIKPLNPPANTLKDEYNSNVMSWKIPLSGPFVNSMLGIASAFLIRFLDIKYTNTNDNLLVYFCYVNIAVAIFNLLPIIGFDGWHIMRYCITKFKFKHPTKISSVLGIAMLVLFIIYCFI